MNNVQKSQTLNNIECPYPEPFLLLTDGLYIRDFSHREEEIRFISNFLPIIDSVVEYDNGKTVEKNYLVKGFMVDGRTLPTVNVDSSELLTLNWVVSKWDASCIIGTQYGAREKLRYAMQTTTGNAKRRVQCGYESEEYYEIFFEQAFRQVMKFCEAQSVNFTISPQALSKALAEEGIILVKNGQNTYTKRYGGNVRRRVMCIKKSEVKNIYGE